MKIILKIILKIWYWILFVLAFAFELLAAVTFVFNAGMEWIDDRLLKYLIKLGEKIDIDDK